MRRPNVNPNDHYFWESIHDQDDDRPDITHEEADAISDGRGDFEPMDDERRDREQPPTGNTCHNCGRTYAELDAYLIGKEWHYFCDERCHMDKCEEIADNKEAS